MQRSATQKLCAWNYERTLLNDRASLETVPSVAVMGEVIVAPVVPSAKLLLTQRSSKLVADLKVPEEFHGRSHQKHWVDRSQCASD